MTVTMLASPCPLQPWPDLQNLILVLPMEKVNNLMFLDKQRGQGDLQGLDLHVLDQGT